MVSGPDAVGLCRACQHHREIVARQSTFWRCGLSDTDPGYPRYPRLPVIQCSGFERLPSGRADGDLTE